MSNKASGVNQGILVFLGVCLITVLSLAGCGAATSTANGGNNNNSNKTYLSFSISPNKTTYSAGEQVTITCTKTGPHNVGASWAMSLKSGTLTSFPQQTSRNFTVTTGSSGFHMVVTGNASATETVNGEEMIIVSGNRGFTIKVL